MKKPCGCVVNSQHKTFRVINKFGAVTNPVQLQQSIILVTTQTNIKRRTKQKKHSDVVNNTNTVVLALLERIPTEIPVYEVRSKSQVRVRTRRVPHFTTIPVQCCCPSKRLHQERNAELLSDSQRPPSIPLLDLLYSLFTFPRSV